MSNASTYDSWRGHTLIDKEGAKVGKIDDIYANDQTGQPEWLTVNTGLFGSRSSFVPIRGSHPEGDDLQVPYTKAQIKEAASVEPDGHISAEEVSSLYQHYALELEEGARRPAAGGPSGTPGERRDAGMARGNGGGKAAGTAAAGTAAAGGLAGRSRPGTAEGRPGAAEGQPAMAGMAAGDDTAGRGGDAAMARGRSARTGPDEGYMTRSEEELRIAKEEVEAGRVRLHKSVVTEHVEARVPLRHEEAHLVREPITDGEAAGALPDTAFTESDSEVVLHEERAIVSKEAVPKERVRIETESVVEERVISDEVRKERIEADGLDDTR